MVECDGLSAQLAGLDSALLGRVCKVSESEHDHADDDHGEVIGGVLLVSGRDTPELLHAMDQAFNLVATRYASEGS